MSPVSGSFLALSTRIEIAGDAGVAFSPVESFYCPVEYFMVISKNTDTHDGTNHGCIPVAISFGEEVFNSGIKDCKDHLCELLQVFGCPSGIGMFQNFSSI